MKYAIVHLADIHYRKGEPEGASTILNALIKDLQKQKESLIGHEFYLAITGDIVFAGKDNESYSSFHIEFNQKLKDIGLTKEFRMIVPGNHDIDRSIVEKDFNDYQSKIYSSIETEQKFNNFIRDENFSDDKFANYELFESDFAKYGIDYSPQGNGWAINNNLGVYCLNTALCSFGGTQKVSDKNKLAVFTRGMIEWCNKTETSTNILLMHHPFSYLNKWSKDEIKQIIENNFSLCLCGHNHEQDIFYNKISHNSLICSAPQVFTNKEDLLGYSIIIIEDNSINKIIYREFVKGKFLIGQRFSENTEGIVSIHSIYLKSIEALEHKLKNALSFFKGQPEVFIKPKLAKEREFNNEPNLLDQIIKDPQPSMIVSHPQFGLTCLSHHMRLEAFKSNNFWVYLDSKHIKARKVKSEIDSQLKDFDKKSEDIKCIIIDSWDSSIIDHTNILKCVDNDYKNIPIIVMSNYSGLYFNSSFNFSKLNSDLSVLHLQAMKRNKVREFISKYNKEKKIEKEDLIVTKVINDLEALNVHRTPFNCLTLLKVFERDFNQSLINRTKMIKAVLFILFTDTDSFTYSTNKPEVDDCEYILGRFCKTLIEKRIRNFTSLEIITELKNYCKEKLISVEVETIINILESNNILLRFNNTLEFKHSYWIYYFAANYMRQDDEFKNYILNDKNYVNFPEIIEFYTGIDGSRNDAIQTLLNDLNDLVGTVENKIGITENFYPFERVIWNPSEGTIETIRKDISEKVKKSNLPTSIKDQHADKSYNSEAPYDQSISQFLNEFSVISLIQSIKASSRALRNSNYVGPDIKKEMMHAILNGWEQMSKVLYWLSPTLAQKGSAAYDGLHVFLLGDLKESCTERLDAILKANPYNVVTHFKDDLSSMKMGPLTFECLKSSKSIIQKHLLSIFLIRERPFGWHKEVHAFMNLLHRNSFLLGDLYSSIKNEIERGFLSEIDLMELKKLVNIVVAKHENAPKVKISEIPKNMTINEKNKLQIDKINASRKSQKISR